MVGITCELSTIELQCSGKDWPNREQWMRDAGNVIRTTTRTKHTRIKKRQWKRMIKNIKEKDTITKQWKYCRKPLSVCPALHSTQVVQAKTNDQASVKRERQDSPGARERDGTQPHSVVHTYRYLNTRSQTGIFDFFHLRPVSQLQEMSKQVYFIIACPQHCLRLFIHPSN